MSARASKRQKTNAAANKAVEEEISFAESKEAEEEPKATAKKGGAGAKGPKVFDFKDEHYYLECKEGTSNKFYEVGRSNLEVATVYGRIGTSGSMAIKAYPTLAEARDFIVKILAEKRNKGYEDKVKDAIPDRSHLVPNVAPQRATAVQATKVEEDNKGAANGASRTVYLECKEGSSNKFYELFLFTQAKVAVYTRYGRIGTSGMESEKSYPSVAEATEFYESTLAEKLKKGYKVKGDQGDDGDYHRGVVVVEAAAAESKPKGGRKAKVSKEEEAPVKEEVKPAAKATARGKKAATTKREDEDAPAPKEEEAVEEAAPKGRKRKAAAITTSSAEAKPVSAPPSSKASSTEADQQVYLECVEGNSSKFYEMSLVKDGTGYSINSRYGRIGADGSSTSKSFDTFDKANALYAKLLKEKQAKGYK